MKQLTFALCDFEHYRKPIRRDKFLAEMDSILPWEKPCEVIEAFYPTIDLESMLRIYFLQHWLILSDPGSEKALYESRSICRFSGIDLEREPVPDVTTILNFCHLLERHKQGDQLFQAVGEYLQAQGMKVTKGTIVDASIINAPSSTKNRKKQRDPQMHQTKKGNQYYFGIKLHIGVDSKTKIIHSLAATPTNVYNSQVLEDQLHGEETRIWGDSAYAGQAEVIQSDAPRAKDFTQTKDSRYKPVSDSDRLRNRTTSKVREKVDHMFAIMNRIFTFTIVRYRGLAINSHALFVLSA